MGLRSVLKAMDPGHISLIMRGCNVAILFTAGLIIPKLIGVNAYGLFAEIQALISLIVLVLVSGIPNLIIRLKNTSNRLETKNSSIRFSVYLFQITLLIIIFIIYWSFYNPEKFSNELNVLIFTTVCLFVVIRIEKSIMVAQGNGLLGQMSELIIFPVVFVILIMLAKQNAGVTDFVSYRFIGLVFAIAITIGLIFLLGNNFSNNDQAAIKLTSLKKDWMLLLIPIFGIQVFFDSLIIMAAKFYSYEYAANLDLAKRFGLLPYLVIVSYMVPMQRKIRLESIGAEEKRNSFEVERKRLSRIVIFLAISTGIVTYLYESLIAPEFKYLTLYTAFFLGAWLLIAPYCFSIQQILISLNSRKLLQFYALNLVGNFALIFALIYFDLEKLIIFAVFSFIVTLGMGSKKLNNIYGCLKC